MIDPPRSAQSTTGKISIATRDRGEGRPSKHNVSLKGGSIIKYYDLNKEKLTVAETGTLNYQVRSQGEDMGESTPHLRSKML